MVTMKHKLKMCQITLAFAFASMFLLKFRHLLTCNLHDIAYVCAKDVLEYVMGDAWGFALEEGVNNVCSCFVEGRFIHLI